MRKQKITISDWIQFLISEKNICHSWLIGYIASLFVLLSIILLLIFSLEGYGGYIVSIPLFVLFGWITILAFDLRPPLKKAKYLLDEIMKNNKGDINDISYRWFEKKVHMNKKIKVITK